MDIIKKQLISGRKRHPYLVRAEQGNGEIYYTNLIVKMITVIVNKLASFDPFVAGLEMDADKPGWCDAVSLRQYEFLSGQHCHRTKWCVLYGSFGLSCAFAAQITAMDSSSLGPHGPNPLRSQLYKLRISTAK